MSIENTPPNWAEDLLRLFLKPDVFASVSGDLLEQAVTVFIPAAGNSERSVVHGTSAHWCCARPAYGPCCSQAHSSQELR
jgi:hypothetical protein